MTSLDDALSGLAKSAAIIFLGTIIGRLLGLFGQILIVRSLEPTSFGHLALAYTVASTLAGLALLGVQDGVTRLMSAEQSPDYRRNVLGGGYAFALFGGIAVSICIYVFRFHIASILNDNELPRLLVLFLPYIVAYTLARVTFGALRAHKRSLGAVVSRDFAPRIGALVIFALFILVGEVFYGAIVYWVATPVIMALVAGYYLHKEIGIIKSISHLPDRDVTQELWSFSWPLALSASFFLLLSNIDILMVGYFMESRSVGLYRAIQPLRQVTTFVRVAFAFLFLPIATEYFKNKDLSTLGQFYTISTKWVVTLSFPPVLVFTLFPFDTVRAFFGTAYTPAAPALAVLTAGLFVRTFVGLGGHVAKAIDRPKIELYSVAAAVVVDIIFNALLIPRYGIVGAAAGTVIGYITYNAIELVAIYWVIDSQPFSADSIKPLFPTLIFALALVHLTSNIDLTLPMLLGIGVVISFVHLVSMILTRSLGREDLLLFERFEDRTGLDLEWFKSLIRSYY